MKKTLHALNSRLAKRVLVYVILASTLVTVFTSGVQIYSEFRREINDVHKEIAQIENTQLSNITSRLWELDIDELKTSISSLLGLPSIHYIAVYEENKKLLSVGTDIQKNIIEKSFPLIHTLGNEKHYLGKLLVKASLDEAYQHIIDRAIIIIISNTIKTFIVAFLILFIFYRLVNRHLSKISSFTQQHDFLSSDEKLVLDKDNKKADELDQLATSINEMHDKLRKQVNDIKQQQLHLSQTLNSIGDAVIVTDSNGNITRLNPVAERLTGWTLKEARGQSVKTIFPIIDATTHLAIENPVEKVIASGEIVYLSNHTTLISKDGTEYQIADSAAPIYDEEKNILGMVLVFNDVTEAYQLRRATALSQKRYEILTQVSPVGIFHTNKEGECLFVNKKWTEISGISQKEAAGSGWVQALHPDDREYVFNEWNQASEENRPFKLEYRFQLTDDVHWVIGEAIAEYADNGEIVGYVGTITDITERKLAERAAMRNAQAMADAQRLAHIGSWELNIANNELQWSDEVYRIFEINPNKYTPSYDAFLNIIHIDDREKVNKAYTESLKNKRPYSINHRLQMPDGRIKHVVERCKTQYDNKGTPLISRGTVQDISEQLMLEDTLQQSQKMDALGKLTGGIAHDYNNMLGVILGYSEILSEKLSHETELQKHVQQITRAGNRGAKLTKKLLSFSRHRLSDLENLNINMLLLEEKDMLQKTLTPRIELIFDLEDNLFPVLLNRNDFEDAIVNLCINASHAMKGKGKLNIHSYNTQISDSEARLQQIKQGKYVCLSFSDTGCGMDEATKEKIFDPFFSTKGDSGTGLGLSQVYGFIKRNNGSIKVHSKLENGTQFLLYFPCSEKNIKQEPRKEIYVSELHGSETILIVDDEPALLELNSEILNSHGYRALCANDALQALEILKTENIDLLLSDIIMPGMDGYELAATVAKNYPKIKIQLASGFNDEKHKGLVEDKLYQQILHKPYDTHTLLKKIRELLD